MGLSLVLAFLGVYVVQERGYPAWLFGVMALVSNVGQSLVSVWAGSLSDRLGRRPLITGGLLVRALVIAALGTEVLLHAPLWLVTITMVMGSALRGCFEPVAYALVTDVARPDQRVAAFGLQRMGTNLGWAIGPAMGGVLTLWMPYGAVFYLATAGLLAAALVTLRIRDEKGPRLHDDRAPWLAALWSSWRDAALRPLLVGTFVAALLHTQMFSTFAIFMSNGLGLSKSSVGLLYTLNGIAVLLMQPAAVAVVSSRRPGSLLVAASLLSGVGFSLVGFAGGAAGGALAILVITAAEVVFSPAHQASIAAIADPRQRGRTFGHVTFAQMLGVAIAPLLGALFLDTFPEAPVVTWAALGSLSVIQALSFRNFLRRQKALV